ncbi:hypothetical protein Pfo_015153 [Paulownia fortunei]|nr:hypothetical protein Pfo_015153 [Paulownia fortunei]
MRTLCFTLPLYSAFQFVNLSSFVQRYASAANPASDMNKEALVEFVFWQSCLKIDWWWDLAEILSWQELTVLLGLESFCCLWENLLFVTCYWISVEDDWAANWIPR